MFHVKHFSPMEYQAAIHESERRADKAKEDVIETKRKPGMFHVKHSESAEPQFGNPAENKDEETNQGCFT